MTDTIIVALDELVERFTHYATEADRRDEPSAYARRVVWDRAAEMVHSLVVDYDPTRTSLDIYSSLRSTGRLYRLSEDMGLRFAQIVREARLHGMTWAEIGRDAKVDPRTAKRYALSVREAP